MKKKVELKKLTLNKEKIATLTQTQARSLLGGGILGGTPGASNYNNICGNATKTKV
jgi:hypothetical protein